jgi:hypothetical protein
MKTVFPIANRWCTLRVLFLVITAPVLAGCRGEAGVAQSLTAHSAAHPDPEPARSAFDFVNSIGLNTHLNYFDRTYGNIGFVEKELRSIGIRHVRDGVHLQNADYNRAVYSRWIELGNIGVRFDAVLDPRNKLGPLTTALLEQVDGLSGHTIESFEGPNELDISSMPDWVSIDRSYQSQIAAAVKGMTDAGRIKVVGPSLAFASHGSELGALVDYLDDGNLHPYPSAKAPSRIFPEQIDLGREVSGEKPILFTESGYHNALHDHHDQPAVSENAAAKYITRLFLEDFAKGIPRTYLYEFLDEAADPGLADNQLHWGLIRADGTEKPAFTAVKRLIEELNDGAAPAQPGQLAWSISNPGSNAGAEIDHLLLQKSNGEFDLVLWQEATSYDRERQSDIANPPVSALLTLGTKAQTVTLYEPVAQNQPMAAYANTTSVPLKIPDHPLVIAIRLSGM